MTRKEQYMAEIVKRTDRVSEPEEKKLEVKKVTPVAKGQIRKPSTVKKAARKFLSDDVGNVKDYIVDDVVIPGIKGAIMGALDMALNGGRGGYSYGPSRGGRSRRVDYGRRYRDDDRRDRVERRERRDHYEGRGWDDEVIVDTRVEAEEILKALDDIIERYSYARVADLYELAQISVGNDYTLNNYGWSDIRAAKVVKVRDGWLIDMPRAIPLD
jgi:hypothetical protein